MSEMMGAVITPDSTITKYIPAPGQAINPRDKKRSFSLAFNNEIWSYNNVEGFKYMMMPVDTLYNYNAAANKDGKRSLPCPILLWEKTYS